MLCIGSGAAFGAIASFGKLVGGSGATGGTLLAVRFALAAVFWAIVLAGGAAARDLRALGRRDAGAGALDPLGAALGPGAAVVYSGYILAGEGISRRIRPRLLCALVCTGAAISLTAGSALLGELRPGALTAAGWGWIACLALVSTVAAIALLFAGLRRGRPDHGGDPRHRRAAGDGAARVPGVRREARTRTTHRRRARARRGGDPRKDGRMSALAGKIALVSGATRGGGRGIAVALGEAGATVYATGRSTRERRSEMDRPETIEETAELVTAAGGEGIAVPVDHLDPAQVAALVERIDAEHGGLDVLVNDIWGAEHLFEWNKPVWEHDLDRGLGVLRLAIDTHLITSHHALRLLVRRPGGLVVEVTDGTAAYNADHYRISMFYDLAKTSAIRMAWGLAQELRPHGATAVAITPGWMRSELMLEIHGVTEANWRDATERTPHFCISESPRYVGRAVAALAADPDAARWSGQSLSSGGLAQVYGFTDLDGTRPDCWRYMVEVVEREGAVAGDAGYR